MQETYRIPTIEVETREDLVKILVLNKPGCIFENIEEVLNPVGRQWNYTLTAKITSDKIGVAIVKYKESFYHKPENMDGILAQWLQKEIPAVDCWYRGILKP